MLELLEYMIDVEFVEAHFRGRHHSYAGRCRAGIRNLSDSRSHHSTTHRPAQPRGQGLPESVLLLRAYQRSAGRRKLGGELHHLLFLQQDISTDRRGCALPP